MPSEILAKQFEFTSHIAELIRFAYVHSYRLTFAEGYVGDTMAAINKPKAEGGQGFPDARSPHRKDGGHFKRLAKDLNLFVVRSGQFELPPDEWEYDWIEGQHPAWLVLGEYWKTLHVDNRWGGDSGDFNHFARLDGGVA